MSDNRLATALTVLPIISAGLYAVGQIFHQSYLREYGIEDSLFVETTNRSVLSGFFVLISALLNLGIKPILYSAFAGLSLIFTTIILVIMLSPEKTENIKSKILTKIQSLISKKKISGQMIGFIDISTKIYTYTAGLFLIAFLTVVMLILSSKIGTEQAIKEKDSFSIGQGNVVTIYSALLQSPTKAKQVSCGASHCAFWLGDRSLIIKTEQIDKLDANKVPNAIP